MKIEEYKTILFNHSIWLRYCESQRLVADSIKMHIIQNIKELIEDEDNYVQFWTNALYHWGIAIENGLKAILVKETPELIEIQEHGENIILKKIGKSVGKTHGLFDMAQTINVFTENELNKHKINPVILEEVLKFLTEIITWGARYPVPIHTGKIYLMNRKVPPILITGFHILDTIEPFIDYIKERVRS